MDNNGGNMPGLTSTLFRIIKEKIPKAYELLLPYEKKIDEAQKWINDNVVGTEIPSWTVIGQGGDEGASDGTHVHMHVIKNDGVPINLYAWADAHEPNILAKVKINNKSDKYPMKYDNAVGALVNAPEQIVHKRVEVTNAVSENWAYALEPSLPVSQMKRVVWGKAGKNSLGVDQFAWLNTETVNGSPSVSVWRKKDNVFGFISLNAYKAENQLS